MSSKRKSRGTETPADTPNSKRRKAAEVETPQKTQLLGYELLKVIRDARDKRNRAICTEFETLPDKEELPDYYEITKLPIALDIIEEKLDELAYPNLTALESDLKRMVVNAKTYNERDSEIHGDAEKIRKLVTTFMTKHNPAYGDPSYTAVPTPIPAEEAAPAAPAEQKIRLKISRESQKTSPSPATGTEETPSSKSTRRGKRTLTLKGPRSSSGAAPDEPSPAPKEPSPAPEEAPPASPGSTSETETFEGKSFQEAQEIILEELLDFTNDEGVDISGPFANLPSRDLRDYYQTIKYPVSLHGIQKKVRGAQGRGKMTGQTLFKSWQAFADELANIWNNARIYNEEGSEIYDAAGELEAHFQKRLEQAKSMVQEPAQPKVTLRVSAKEVEPSPKLKLTVSNKTAASEGYSVDTEALKRQQDVVAAATGSATRSSSQRADDSRSMEPPSNATPDLPPNDIKAETAVSQSPPASSVPPPASSASAEHATNAAAAATGSVPPSANDNVPVEGSPAPSLPRAPPPPPPRDPLESRLRPAGKGVADALISAFSLDAHPSIRANHPFRLSVPPSAHLSQQTATVVLPDSLRALRASIVFSAALLQRPNRILMRVNKEYIQPLPHRADVDARSRMFDISLIPGSVNVMDLEVLFALTPRGAPKVGTGSEYDYERITIYFHVFGA